MAVTKYIVFRLNDQKYSMKLTKINGIEYVYHVVPVPMGPASVSYTHLTLPTKLEV